MSKIKRSPLISSFNSLSEMSLEVSFRGWGGAQCSWILSLCYTKLHTCICNIVVDYQYRALSRADILGGLVCFSATVSKGI